MIPLPSVDQILSDNEHFEGYLCIDKICKYNNAVFPQFTHTITIRAKGTIQRPSGLLKSIWAASYLWDGKKWILGAN